MTATQNQAMDAASGGVSGYSADDAAADIVTAELLHRGYRVIERQALNAVLREQGFQQSGMVDQATAVRIGQLAGAEAIVIANVYNTSKAYHQGFPGGTGNVLADTVGKVLDPSGIVHTVDMSVKMIDVQTAEVVWLQDKSAASRPGETTSYTDLLRGLVASLPFPSPATIAALPPEGSEKGPGKKPRPSHEPNPEVRRVQGLLRERGYDPGPIDGLMGQRTRQALRQFQRDHNLPETGRIDVATENALGLVPARTEQAY
jgi:hypothetical protein